MTIRIACAAFTMLIVCNPAAAQGFFDFGQVPGVPEHPTVQVDLDAALLDFVAAVAEREDAAAAEIIGGLESVHVLVYDEFEDPAAVSEFVDETSAALERGGWKRTVYVQEDDEKVRIYTRVAGSNLEGMTVLVLDSSEATFINIAGPIEPAQLGRVASAMGFGDFLGVLASEDSGYGTESDEHGE